MDKNPVGRPTIMTPEVVNKLEQAFSNGATDVQACFYAGISKQTLYNYQEDNPDFIDRKEALKSNLALIAKNVLAKSIKDGDVKDAQWYLERKDPEFNLKIKTENREVDKDGNDVERTVVVKGIDAGN